MADNAPILVIVPPRTAAKQKAEEDWGPVGRPSTLAPGHPHLLEGSFPARGPCARVFFSPGGDLPRGAISEGARRPPKVGPKVGRGLPARPKIRLTH